MTEAQQNDDEVIELPETVPPISKPEPAGECPLQSVSLSKEAAEQLVSLENTPTPESEVVIPPAPPMPKPELVGEMPPLKWRKKYMQRKLRRQGRNRLTRRSRTL